MMSSSTVTNCLEVVQVFCWNCCSLLVTTMLGIKYFRHYLKIFSVAIWPHHLGVIIQKYWWNKRYHWCPTRFLQRLRQNITSTQQPSYQLNKRYISSIKAGYQVNPEASLLHCKVEKVSMFHCFNDFMSNTDEILETNNEQMKVEQLHISPWARNLQIFEEVENAGGDIFHRYKC